jgi:putative zinc finger protein
MANSQTIEARLCAYIEGDLSDAERDAIERHLDAHPQHRVMIRDLTALRRCVGQLPRLPAPADLGEGLQGQIERSMLLGQDEPPQDQWRKHVRRILPRAALAAVLLMTFALSVVILQLLRAASKPAPIATITEPLDLPPAPDQPIVAPTPASPPPPALLSPPATQPIRPIETVPPLAATPPDTQPAALAVAPTTQPIELTDDFDDVQDGLETDFSPTTQPAPAALSSALPATQPVADNAGQQ